MGMGVEPLLTLEMTGSGAAERTQRAVRLGIGLLGGRHRQYRGRGVVARKDWGFEGKMNSF